MENFEQRLDFIIAKIAKGKQNQFAKLLNVTNSTISKFRERGEIPEKYLPLLETFGVNIHWLQTGEGKPFLDIPNAQPVDIGIEKILEQTRKLYGIRRVKIPANAGVGYTFQEIEEEQVLYVPTETRINPKEWVLFTVTGKSMEPVIPENSTVFVHTTEQPTNGKVVVCTLNTILYCKVYERRNGRIFLCSYNPEYSDIEVSEYDDFRIIGVVRKIEKNL